MEEAANSVVDLVFHNHVIVGNILSYLDFSSIKALSCVSVTLNQLIRRNSNVLNRATFSFFYGDPLNQQSSKPSTFSPHKFYWTNVCVQLHSGWEKNEFNAILSLVSTIKKLEVYATWMRGIDSEVIFKEKIEMFLALLNSATELNELAICANVLDMIGLEEFSRVLNKYDNVQANLEKLESLMIRSQNSKDYYGMFTARGFGSILALLGVMPKALTRFGICRITQFGFDSLEPWPLFGLEEGVFSVIEKYSASLNSVVLEKFMWELPNARVESLVFPSLQHLSVSTEAKHLPRVTNFLNRQPPLRSLTLTLETNEVDCRSLMAPILRHGPSLKQLTLSWKESFSAVEVSRTFSCVKNFGFLRQLSLRLTTEKDYGSNIPASLAAALAILPDGICELNLAGLPVGDWNYISVPSEVARFQGLTKLNLVNCPNILNDYALGQICSQMTQLLEFGFSHCDEVTDWGLTRVPGLGALKGLRKLEILSCKKLTPAALGQVIIFEELRELTIVFCKKYDAPKLEFYTTLLTQNKNLKILKISTTESEREAEIQKALKQESQTFHSLLFIKPLRRPEFHESDDDEYDDENDDDDEDDDDEEDYDEDEYDEDYDEDEYDEDYDEDEEDDENDDE